MADKRKDLDARRASFLSRVDQYERYRPGYPVDAIRWLVGSSRRRVIDLGCGPGNLTTQLVKLGHDVFGADPSEAMLQSARRKGLRVVRAMAEQVPLRDACADVVTAATAFHWFEAAHAVPEMRRVLAPGGRVALITNIPDETVPWIKAVSDVTGSESAMAATLDGAEGIEAEFVAKLEGGGLFAGTECHLFDYEQELTPEQLVGLVTSGSHIAILPETERQQLLEQVRKLCREHPGLRDRASFVMPYVTHAFRSFVA